MLIGWVITYTYKSSRYICEMNMQPRTQKRKAPSIFHCNDYNFAFCPNIGLKEHKKPML